MGGTTAAEKSVLFLQYQDRLVYFTFYKDQSGIERRPSNVGMREFKQSLRLRATPQSKNMIG